MAKAKKIGRDFYSEFEKYKAEYFERKKSEYLFAIQIATIKNAGHNVFERREMKPESDRLQKELGLYSRLIIDIEHEIEVDGRISINDRFNQKISEIATNKREIILKGIAEYEGLRELYTFWSHKKDYIKIIDDPFSQPVESLIYLERDFADSFKTMITERERSFTESLSMRVTNSEKIDFTRKEINVQRALIECDLLYKYFTFLNQHPERFGELIAHNWKNFHHVSTVLFGDRTEEGEEALNVLIAYVFQREKEMTKDEISASIKSLKEKGIESNALYNLLRSQYREPEHRLFYITFYFHYEKEYLNFLLEKYKEMIEPETGNVNEENINKEFTIHRQVLAIHYLLDTQDTYTKADKTEIARFIQFITGKETGTKKIADTNIYKKLKKPLDKTDKGVDSDLRFIREYFEKLNLQSVVDKINREIGIKE